MNRKYFSNLIANPSSIKNSDIEQLSSIVNEFPYFQAVKAIYLKGLKDIDSFKYNKTLKVTAAYTTDREILFDFITSEIFLQNTVSDLIKNNSEISKDIDINEYLDISDNPIVETNFDKDEESIILGIGKPFEFRKDESYSFSKWLQLTKIDPIDRDTTNFYEKNKKQNNIDLIDRFIEKSPKIKPLRQPKSYEDLSQRNIQDSSPLMTETLARVYLEQKNYDQAIQSYKILCLKYPEKSALFADQIKAIEKLQEKIKKS